MKTKKPEELLTELGIDYESGKYKNRYIRYLSHIETFQIGEPDGVFDRWANSVDYTFNLFQKKGQRQLIKWIIAQEK